MQLAREYVVAFVANKEIIITIEIAAALVGEEGIESVGLGRGSTGGIHRGGEAMASASLPVGT